jgi:formylmethanofuran dehydrogenase subunit C
LFIAAMCNHVQAEEIRLNLHTLTRRWPFLGYRLPRGRCLRLDGNAGDFVGALLEGGEVIVTGNAGNYAGIGMKSGTLHIQHSTGKYAGEGMRGGTLQVDGYIGSLGKAKSGSIYESHRQVFPSVPESPPTPRRSHRA